MTSSRGPAYHPFMVTAEAVALERADVDPDMAREVFEEAATLLHNGLVLDGLDDHDTDIVVAALCRDLVSDDPGSAVRARAAAVLESPGDLHDPAEASVAYLNAVAVLQL